MLEKGVMMWLRRYGVTVNVGVKYGRGDMEWEDRRGRGRRVSGKGEDVSEGNWMDRQG